MTNYPLDTAQGSRGPCTVPGLIQGVALVTFPAAGVVFTSAAGYGLSRTEYGGMFVPQALTAIGSSLLGAGLARRLGAKRIFLIGLVANLASMALLVLEPVRDERARACLRGPARRHRLPRRRFRFHGADAQHLRRRLLSSEGGQGCVGAERPAGVRHCAGADSCRGVRRSGLLVGTSGAGWRADPGVAPVQCALAAQSGCAGGRRRRRGRADEASFSVLGVRRIRALVRCLRNDERHLGFALHDEGTGRKCDAVLARPDRVLGHGDGRARPLCPRREMVARARRLPGPAVARGRWLCRPCLPAAEPAAPRHPGLCARRLRLLGLAAAGHQLRSGGTQGHRRIDGRWVDCVLPDRLRDRGLWRRPSGVTVGIESGHDLWS